MFNYARADLAPTGPGTRDTQHKGPSFRLMLALFWQGKDKGQTLAPAELDDASVDEDGNPLPRVFVPRAGVAGLPMEDGVLSGEVSMRCT